MSKPKVIAFYLPQYHPVKENNEWFGEGFTEWTNVGKAKPLFRGHDQPRVPADLGYYDLRIGEVREKQAEFAKKAEISAFCYYHYWFGNGTKILEKPLESIIENRKPDFPFCLCWANHSWYKKNWNPDTKKIDQRILIEQTYPGGEDVLEHFNYLLPAFKDERYFKINGRLVFVIYDCLNFPDFESFKTSWNNLAEMNGLPHFYFIGYAHFVKQAKSELYSGFDGVILSQLESVVVKQKYSKIRMLVRLVKEKISEIFHYPLFVYPYKTAIRYLLDDAESEENIIPEIIPNWDYTPRRGAGGLILTNSTPELFKRHALQALNLIKNKPQDKQIIFLKSWNEWGEGNYMEPDIKYGHGYINALREAIEEFSS